MNRIIHERRLEQEKRFGAFFSLKVSIEVYHIIALQGKCNFPHLWIVFLIWENYKHIYLVKKMHFLVIWKFSKHRKSEQKYFITFEQLNFSWWIASRKINEQIPYLDSSNVCTLKTNPKALQSTSGFHKNLSNYQSPLSLIISSLSKNDFLG